MARQESSMKKFAMGR